MTGIYKQTIGADIWGEMAAPSTVQTNALETQYEALAGIFMMPNDDTITIVGFVNATATNAAAIEIDSYTISIQALDTSGFPDNTILGGGSPASQVFPDANGAAPAGGTVLGTATSHIITLANSIALQGGTSYALVIMRTGSSDAVNFTTPRTGATMLGQVPRFPYSLIKDATSSTTVWSKVANTLPIGFFLRSATKTYGYPNTNFATAQTFGLLNEDGFSFTLPSAFGASNTYAVRGVRFMGGANTAAGTWRVNLYTDPLTTTTDLIIQQTTGAIDSDYSAAATAGFYEVYFPEDSLVALTPGTVYGLGFSHSASAGFGLQSVLVPDAAAKTAYPLGGFTFMTRTIAAYPPANTDNEFTTTATTIVRAELILGDFTAAAGGGGMQFVPNLSGT